MKQSNDNGPPKMNNLTDLDNEVNVLDYKTNIEREVLIVSALHLSDFEICSASKQQDLLQGSFFISETDDILKEKKYSQLTF